MIRQLAQKYKIPVLMATDTGDGALIDIERYDLNEKTIPFGGRLDLTKKPDDFLKVALSVISPEHIPITLQDRFFEIGKTIPTHPQLANSAYFSGTVVSYLVRMLANKREIVDDRVYIDYDELFDPKYKNKNFQKIKKEKLDAFKKALGLN